MTALAEPSAARADAYATKSGAFGAFMRQRSAHALGLGFILLLAARTVMGAVGRVDLLAVAITAALVGPFEWFIHRTFLHAPETSRRMTRIGTGRGHVEHHKDPLELRWLLLCWREAILFCLALGVVSAVWTFPLAVALDAPFAPTAMTAWVAAAAGLLHYEWVHLLVHTRYRCRSRYYRALERHHRLHHYRNEHYWLGVTSRNGDRLLSTMPDKSDVEQSPTARSLGS